MIIIERFFFFCNACNSLHDRVASEGDLKLSLPEINIWRVLCVFNRSECRRKIKKGMKFTLKSRTVKSRNLKSPPCFEWIYSDKCWQIMQDGTTLVKRGDRPLYRAGRKNSGVFFSGGD